MTPLSKPYFAILVIGAAVLAAYANSLRGPFVFDDASSIVTNPTIRQLWPLTGPLAAPTTNVTAQARPILNLSLAVNYAWGGEAVVGYHVVNVAIHGLAALVLFGLLRRTLGRVGLKRPDGVGGIRAEPRVEDDAPGLLALAVALLWAVHPLQTEAVTYVIQRAESLMGLFYLLTVYGFMRSVESARKGVVCWQTLAVVACALGMGTKEVMATAPLMVWLYDRTFVAGSFAAALRRRWPFYVALAATWMVLAGLVLQGGGNRGGSKGFGTGVDAWAWGLTQFEAVAVYLRLAFWPEPLVFQYGTFWVTGMGAIIGEAALVVALLAVTVRGLWRGTALGFAGAWFFGILAPTSLAPGTGQMLVEHRMYLPLAAVLAVAVVGAWRTAGARRRAALPAVLGVVTLGAIALTVRRNADYRTEVALWSDTIAKRPENPLAHHQLAGAWERAGEPGRALASYAEALRLKPDFSAGQENYGELLLKEGRRAEAIGRFETALRLQPEFADAHANLGNALLAEGRPAEAVAHLAEAVRIAPGFFEMHFNFANALAAAGRWAEAAEQYRLAVKLQRLEGAEVHFNLGNALGELGRGDEAMAEYRVAVRVRPDYAAAHYNLANALALAGRPGEAVAAYGAALRARPDYAAAHHNLGSALFQLGRLAEAERAYAETLRLAPDFPEARAHLEQVRARLPR
ncbi:MAG: tetratricopeptide repeat protein [Undibacterium sp.]|nr:tetratricopeptide repeat protein [Opitutaceae bacterium]